MPERFNHSVPFTLDGQRFVQVGDAGHPCFCLVPCPGDDLAYGKVKFVVDALNLADRAEKLTPKAITDAKEILG